MKIVKNELLNNEQLDINKQNNCENWYISFIYGCIRGYLAIVKFLMKVDRLNINSQNNYGDLTIFEILIKVLI